MNYDRWYAKLTPKVQGCKICLSLPRPCVATMIQKRFDVMTSPADSHGSCSKGENKSIFHNDKILLEGNPSFWFFIRPVHHCTVPKLSCEKPHIQHGFWVSFGGLICRGQGIFTYEWFVSKIVRLWVTILPSSHLSVSYGKRHTGCFHARLFESFVSIPIMYRYSRHKPNC